MTGTRPSVTTVPTDAQHVDVVYARVRDAILCGEIRPGEELRQERVAHNLNVSRTPLREALRMLEREGLVDGAPNRSYRVSGFSLRDLEELYILRLPMEAAAIRMTIPLLGSVEIAALEGSMAQMAHFAQVRDHELWEVPHRAFHAGLVAKAGGRITRLLKQLSDHSERYRRMYKAALPHAWSRSADQHRSILDACAAGDADRGADQLARHLFATAEHVIEAVDPSYDATGLRMALAMARTPLPSRSTPPGGGAPGRAPASVLPGDVPER
jgi:GntR family transcriptional regulator, rspAB operon transcriptional repressor